MYIAIVAMPSGMTFTTIVPLPVLNKLPVAVLELGARLAPGSGTSIITGYDHVRLLSTLLA
jgi:hypothetical protein